MSAFRLVRQLTTIADIAYLVFTMDDFRRLAKVRYHLPLALTLRDWIKPLCDLPADLVRRLARVSKINGFERTETDVASLATA